MSSALRFQDHQTFQRSAGWMFLFGPLAAFAVIAIGASPLAAIPMAIAAVVLAAKWAQQKDEVEAIWLTALFTACAGVLIFASRSTTYAELGFLGFAIISALPLCLGLQERRSPWVFVTALVIGAAGLWIAHAIGTRVMQAQELGGLPTLLVGTLAGTAVAAAGVFSILPRHLSIQHDQVASVHKQLTAGSMDPEIATLVSQGHQFWEDCKRDLPEGDTNREILREASLRFMQTAEAWQSSGAKSRSSVESLQERADDLQKRIEASSDPVAASQYQQAKEGVEEQLRYVQTIARNRDRIVSRLHNYLAAMERLRLAVANLASTEAGHSQADLGSLVDTLGELGEGLNLRDESQVALLS